MEAGVLRTPVLCSNLTAMKYFDFFNPLMFDPQSENIINVYNDLIFNDNLPDQEKIREKIIKKYNWKNWKEKLFGAVEKPNLIDENEFS